MAIWKDETTVKKESVPMSADVVPRKDPDPKVPAPTNYGTLHPTGASDAKESLIAADLTIEGKIEGAGHVRIAGRFKGDVSVQGNLTIEPGAKLTGGVRANTVIIGGELEGNIDAATRVELLATGVLNGDLKAGSLTVAAGSRMRGQMEFGWDDKSPNKSSAMAQSAAAL